MLFRSWGQGGFLRVLAAGSQSVGDGLTLLSAVERVNQNGPWTTPEGLRKLNALFTLGSGSGRESWSTSLSAYSASWNATDPIPQRLIDAGRYRGQAFGRYDSLDPSDGGQTQRLSLSGQWRRNSLNQLSAVQWYAVRYDLDLYSNFTYALNRASDQFAQTDQRTVLGGQGYQTWVTELDGDRVWLNTLGIQWRQDQMRVGLGDTTQRQWLSTVRDDQVRQSMLGVYAQSEMHWNPWLRTIAGLRADQLSASVTSLTQAANSGSAGATKLSPKGSVIVGPWQRTELFLNAGLGIHSNDARGMTARIDPRTGQAIDRVPALVASRGQEIGLKSEAISNLQTSLAWWRLHFDSELVYRADTGDTQEIGRAHV